MSTSSPDFASLLDLAPSIPPLPVAYSLIGECLASVASCSTIESCNALTLAHTSTGSAFRALSESDKATVRNALATRIATLTEARIAETLATPIVQSTTINEALDRVAAEIPVAAPRARRSYVRRDQTAAQITASVLDARKNGARLAGYDGQIVDPTGSKGIGTVIAFGSADTEYDVIADRDRQIMISWSTVESSLASAGFDRDLLGEPVTKIAHLGQATKILNHSGYIARNVRNISRGVRSAWIIGKVDASLDGDTLGDRECLISLQTDGSLVLSNPTHVAALQVAREYDNRLASVLVESSDLRARMERTLRSDFGARKTDLGLYVSPYHTDRAMTLIVAMRPVCGRKIYAWSHTDAGSIAEALTDSFAADLGRLDREIATKSADLKRLAGASLIERIERLKVEISALGRVLGDSTVTAYKARIVAMELSVNDALDSTSARAANLEMT